MIVGNCPACGAQALDKEALDVVPAAWRDKPLVTITAAGAVNVSELEPLGRLLCCPCKAAVAIGALDACHTVRKWHWYMLREDPS